MRIAVLNNCMPFLRGGAEHLAEALTLKLAEYGHSAVLVRVPFRWHPSRHVGEHMLACRLMKLPNIDRAIALKFPAYYVPQANKVVWLLHQFRQAYDLLGTAEGLSENSEGRETREMVVQADNSYLPEARKIFANSHITAERLNRYNHLQATVLYPPLLRHDHFTCAEYGDYVLVPGRINEAKRQRLIVEAVHHCKSNVKVVVAGSPERLEDAKTIRSLIGNDDRVLFIDRFISEDEKVELFSHALACAYLPYDEDSYGYVTLESYFSKKPVITCTDSGGIGLLVKDEITGLVVPPDPLRLALAMDRLFDDKVRARRMGEAGCELVESMNITWDHVIESLTK